MAILPAGLAVLKALPRHIRSPYVLWNPDTDGKPYVHMNRGLAGAAQRAKVSDLKWHDLRRTHGCRLLQDLGWSMAMVRDSSATRRSW